ncbi:Chaperone protein dnaJ 8 [Abeliophyllum distichum]|uniref:Chaperone protein dnaJ 8 n=1 Tax=Abeliophyllum distichum TaxID=126358 RepID=A0ABD1PEY2_9LAMI
MASAVGCGCASSSWIQFKDSKKNVKNGFRISSFYSSYAMGDPYKTLRIQPDASESEVKKAFRKLALQYHPDVCRGSNCGIQFHQINEAYDMVMNNIREQSKRSEMTMYENYEAETDDSMGVINEQDWDLWEEWMGWEGAGIRDYSSHINPYI